MNLEDPFVLAHYHLASPDIKRLSKQLRFWVYASIKGGMITGEKRIGKTYAIKFILAHLAKVLGRDCYAFSIRWKAIDRFNETKFWKRLLGATGFNTTLPGDAERLENRFYERILLKIEQCGIPVCVVFIDEAQNITITEYLQLCHVFNELEEKGIRLYTWLVGQDELHHMKTLMREANCGQVIARFMEHSFEMRGISNARTLRTLLVQLDKQGVPEAASTRAVEAGFKLSELSSDLWAAKRTVDKENSRSVNTPWTMQQFQSIVAVLLQNLERQDASIASIAQEDLEEIIRLVQTDVSFSVDDDAES